jgi:hypothetical protein
LLLNKFGLLFASILGVLKLLAAVVVAGVVAGVVAVVVVVVGTGALTGDVVVPVVVSFVFGITFIIFLGLESELLLKSKTLSMSWFKLKIYCS